MLVFFAPAVSLAANALAGMIVAAIASDNPAEVMRLRKFIFIALFRHCDVVGNSIGMRDQRMSAAWEPPPFKVSRLHFECI